MTLIGMSVLIFGTQALAQGIVSRPSNQSKTQTNSSFSTPKADNNNVRQIVDAFLNKPAWNCLEKYNKYQVSDGMEVFESEFGGYVVAYDIPLCDNSQPLVMDQTGKTLKWMVCLYGPGMSVSAMEFNTFVLYGELDEIAKKFANSINANNFRQLKTEYGLSLFLASIKGKTLGICCSHGVHGGAITAIIGDKIETENWVNQKL